MVPLAQGTVCINVIERAHIVIRGAVQGVGFRPFAYRLATEMKLCGWVLNSPQGVFIEAEGEAGVLDSFLIRLEREKPRAASIQSLESTRLDPHFFRDFEIRPSENQGENLTLVLPDIATCQDCLSDIFNSNDRRYLYPFTNCTNCGPRFSIINALPYDRVHTSMKSFEMCPQCRNEYQDPLDRRFHAQPAACPACGPHLELWDPKGKALGLHHQALLDACAVVREGRILGLKGLGGFQLIVDATNDEAVGRLRSRKHREEKPFALLCPSLDAVKSICHVSVLEERLLLSPESPIVLLDRINPKTETAGVIAPSVAPRNPYLGIMLPYTPLHHLLMRELKVPVVATSGNLSDEPICIEEREALNRLEAIADFFLVHNRPIVRHIDDSIVRVMMGRELVLRRARGYAPLPLRLSEPAPKMLAVGGHLKSTVAMTARENVFISQHIGDLENKEAVNAFHNVIDSFKQLYHSDPEVIVADSHPDYVSTRYAMASGKRVVSVQHHHAHVASCMAENRLEGPVLGVSWDGTGYGLDGTIWGGEFLLADQSGFRRMATFRRFQLPGGERAIKEPRRTALGVLFEIYGESLSERLELAPLKMFSKNELNVLLQMVAGGIHSPWTSSVGRLFDAVASLMGLRQFISFEGQAAMEMEFAIPERAAEETPLPYRLTTVQSSADNGTADPTSGTRNELIVIDWEPIVLAILNGVKIGKSIGCLSAAFHNVLVEIILSIAKRISQERIVLSGGCFQNKYLSERAIERLRSEGFRPYWHQRIPPNDGGIALGQIVAAAGVLGKSGT
jgi:hydrogenase maturation protein HypF